jgi:drug/metabolite transporter (DMT)-like permease
MDNYISNLPLLLVFLSGIGFSVQTLIIKLLVSTKSNFHISIECIFMRGVVQLVVMSNLLLYNHFHTPANEEKVKLFGSNLKVKLALFGRSTLGFFSMVCAFIAAEKLPVGDTAVLIMLSPMVASISGYIFLGEPWTLAEFISTILSLTGAVFIAKPSFLFGTIGDRPPDALGVVLALIAAVGAGKCC